MNYTILISIISTIISSAAFALSYRAHKNVERIRLHDRAIELRERFIDIRCRLNRCEVSFRLVNIDDEKVRGEIGKLIADSANSMMEYQEILNVSANILTEVILDNATIFAKKEEENASLLEHKIQILIDETKHNMLSLTYPKDVPTSK